MKARALATFRMQQTLVRAGDIFESDDDHIRALMRNRLAELVPDLTPDPVEDEDAPELETKPLPVAVETKPAPAAKKGNGKGKAR